MKSKIILFFIFIGAGIVCADWVEPRDGLRYQVLNDIPDEKSLFATVGFGLNSGFNSVIEMRGALHYTVNYSGFDPVVLTIDHGFFNFDVFNFGSGIDKEVNTLSTRSLYSNLVVGAELVLFENIIDFTKQIFVASEQYSNYTINYFFEAPATMHTAVSLIGGYTHLLGDKIQVDRPYDIMNMEENQTMGDVYIGEQNMHGIYGGVSLTLRHHLELEYDAYDLENIHNDDMYMKHTLYVRWFPSYTIDSGSMPDLFEAASNVSFTYSFNMILWEKFGIYTSVSVNPKVSLVNSSGDSSSFSSSSFEYRPEMNAFIGISIALSQ